LVHPQRDDCDVEDQIGTLADVDGNLILQLIGHRTSARRRVDAHVGPSPLRVHALVSDHTAPSSDASNIDRDVGAVGVRIKHARASREIEHAAAVFACRKSIAFRPAGAAGV